MLIIDSEDSKGGEGKGRERGKENKGKGQEMGVKEEEVRGNDRY